MRYNIDANESKRCGAVPRIEIKEFQQGAHHWGYRVTPMPRPSEQALMKRLRRDRCSAAAQSVRTIAGRNSVGGKSEMDKQARLSPRPANSPTTILMPEAMTLANRNVVMPPKTLQNGVLGEFEDAHFQDRWWCMHWHCLRKLTSWEYW